MKQVLIDTNVYSRGLGGDDWASGILRRADELLLSPIVVGELYAGFSKGTRKSQNVALFNEFILSPRITIATIGIETSEFYDVILTQLRSQGSPIPTNDIWIAASAMEHGAHLATMDNHFKRVAGLLTIYPD